MGNDRHVQLYKQSRKAGYSAKKKARKQRKRKKEKRMYIIVMFSDIIALVHLYDDVKADTTRLSYTSLKSPGLLLASINANPLTEKTPQLIH